MPAVKEAADPWLETPVSLRPLRSPKAEPLLHQLLKRRQGSPKSAHGPSLVGRHPEPQKLCRWLRPEYRPYRLQQRWQARPRPDAPLRLHKLEVSHLLQP